jgi:hypothetical protein
MSTTTPAASLLLLPFLLLGCEPAPVDAPVPATRTIHGVVYNEVGQLQPGATVVVPGVGSTTTDGAGKFVLPGVTPPYDLVVVQPTAAGSSGTLVQGITREDVRVTAQRVGEAAVREATLTRHLTGRLLTPSAGGMKNSTSVFTSPSLLRERVTTDDGVAGSEHVAKVTWANDVAPSGTFHVLEQLSDARGVPLEYAYGHTDGVTLVNGAKLPVSVDLGAVDSSALAVNVAVPPDFALLGVQFELEFPNRQTAFLSSTSTSTPAVTVPRVPGLRVLVSALAKNSATGGQVVARKPVTTESSLSLSLPTSAPTQSLPLPNVTGVDLPTQRFSWAAVAEGGISQVSFELGSFTLTVITPETHLTLPDLRQLGLGSVASGTKCSWRVTSATLLGSADAAVDPAANPATRLGDLSSVTGAASGWRNFTAR